MAIGYQRTTNFQPPNWSTDTAHALLPMTYAAVPTVYTTIPTATAIV